MLGSSTTTLSRTTEPRRDRTVTHRVGRGG
jgi:hypothetical protein